MTVSNFSSKDNWANCNQISGVEPSGAEGTKMCSNGPVHMTNLATMHVYCKTFRILLHWNLWTNGHEI